MRTLCQKRGNRPAARTQTLSEFYFTKDSLGISIYVEHVRGGHAEFEIAYEDIADNFKNKNDAIWSDFVPVGEVAGQK